MPLSTGVPQNSVAGPGTFASYTQPVVAIARKHCTNLHLYAYDTQLHIGFHQQDYELTKQRLESCLSEIRTLMSAYMFKLDDGKTAFFFIGRSYTIIQVPDVMTSIEIGEEKNVHDFNCQVHWGYHGRHAQRGRRSCECM